MKVILFNKIFRVIISCDFYLYLLNILIFIKKSLVYIDKLKHSKNPIYQQKSRINLKCRILLNGAGGGGRTHTVLPPLDFESSTSANSITPAYKLII